MFCLELIKKAISLIKEINNLTKEIKSLRKLIGLRRPGLVFAKVIEEKNGMLKFKLLLPAPGASDVVSRELTVKIGEADPTTTPLEGTAVESAEMECTDSTPVTGNLVDVDDAGNRSEARTFEFIVVDTIAPPAPGEIGLAVVAEV